MSSTFFTPPPTVKGIKQFFAVLFTISKSNPLEYWDNNVRGTISLVKIMEKYNCRNLIFSSSASVYGESGISPFKEKDDLNPISPYGNTKLAIEKMLMDIAGAKPNNWKIFCLRYFNPIGAHHSGLIGEDLDGVTNNLFPLILKSFLGNHKLLVYGKDWPTADGTCIRDYILSLIHI